jgi:hypothetical protein
MIAALPIVTQIATAPGGASMREVVEALVVVGLAAREWRQTSTEKRRRAATREIVEETVRAAVRPLGEKLDRFDREVGLKIEQLFGYVIGPDGSNGIRGDVRELRREIEGRVGGLEERERKRLERGL